MIFKNGTLFFKYEENHDKNKNAQRTPPSSLIIIIGPLGGLFFVQF
jgi:16S rRNA U1498 N3-methylase RsmE